MIAITNYRSARVPQVDWSAGVRDRTSSTPEGMRTSARIALDRAREWIETAEQLLAKAADLEADSP